MVETGVKTFHNVVKFMDKLLKIYSKSKYRFFIIKEMKDTEITYIEQLTRMVGIKCIFLCLTHLESN